LIFLVAIELLCVIAPAGLTNRKLFAGSLSFAVTKAHRL